MEPLKPNEPPFEPSAGDGFAHDVSGGGADPDFELLENYLDGELLPAEARRVERRLSAEPELSAALSRMSAEYALRRAAFRSLEPDERVADALSDAVVISAQRTERPRERGLAGRRAGWQARERSLRLGRLVGALAACVAVSFCAGWIGRGYAAQSQAQAKAGPPAASTPAEKEKAEPAVYQVALTDEQGNITAVQKFDSLEEAQSFAADVGRWQARQQQLRQNATAAGPPVVNSSGL